MKKGILYIGFFLLFSTQLSAQSKSDQALILQKCIDLPELQQCYPLAEDGSISQLYVMQHGISFPVDIEVTKSGKPLAFVGKSDINEQHIECYFLFWIFEINNDKARIEYTYNSNLNIKKANIVELSLQKVDGKWNIIKSKVERK
jgi:hypothetical protein